MTRPFTADSRQQAEKQFKAGKKADPSVDRFRDEARRAEAMKTTRLRSLRLAKEASDKDAAARDLEAAKTTPLPRRQKKAPAAAPA
jgi:hypothetical protein